MRSKNEEAKKWKKVGVIDDEAMLIQKLEKMKKRDAEEVERKKLAR